MLAGQAIWLSLMFVYCCFSPDANVIVRTSRRVHCRCWNEHADINLNSTETSCSFDLTLMLQIALDMLRQVSLSLTLILALFLSHTSFVFHKDIHVFDRRTHFATSFFCIFFFKLMHDPLLKDDVPGVRDVAASLSIAFLLNKI